jgi:hypothetical protein
MRLNEISYLVKKIFDTLVRYETFNLEAYQFLLFFSSPKFSHAFDLPSKSNEGMKKGRNEKKKEK